MYIVSLVLSSFLFELMRVLLKGGQSYARRQGAKRLVTIFSLFSIVVQSARSLVGGSVACRRRGFSFSRSESHKISSAEGRRRGRFFTRVVDGPTRHNIFSPPPLIPYLLAPHGVRARIQRAEDGSVVAKPIALATSEVDFYELLMHKTSSITIIPKQLS